MDVSRVDSPVAVSTIAGQLLSGVVGPPDALECIPGQANAKNHRAKLTSSHEPLRQMLAAGGSVEALAALDCWEDGELIVLCMQDAKKKDADFPKKNEAKWKAGRGMAVQSCARAWWLGDESTAIAKQVDSLGRHQCLVEPAVSLKEFCEEVEAELGGQNSSLSSLSPKELHLLADARMLLSKFVFVQGDLTEYGQWIQKAIDCLQLLPADAETDVSPAEKTATASATSASFTDASAGADKTSQPAGAGQPPQDAATTTTKKSKNKKARRRAQKAAAAATQHAAEKNWSTALRFLFEKELRPAHAYETNTKHRKLFRAYFMLSEFLTRDGDFPAAARTLQQDVMRWVRTVQEREFVVVQIDRALGEPTNSEKKRDSLDDWVFGKSSGLGDLPIMDVIRLEPHGSDTRKDICFASLQLVWLNGMTGRMSEAKKAWDVYKQVFPTIRAEHKQEILPYVQVAQLYVGR